jgi:cytoskeletal protein RodZ
MLGEELFAVAGFGAGLSLVLFILWSLAWKGFALWIAAKEGKKIWFIFILVLNTLGILEILYIFVFSGWAKEFWAKRKEDRTQQKVEKEEQKESAEEEKIEERVEESEEK